MYVLSGTCIANSVRCIFERVRSAGVVKWKEERQLVLSTGLKLVEKGLVTGTAGNVSLRLTQEGSSGLIAITPTSRYYDTLTIDDIPVIDFTGAVVDGHLKPSSEMRVHIAIYKARPDVGAVIHTHSTYASAASVARLEIPVLLEEEAIFLGGTVRTAGYARTGTSELAQNAVAALEDRNAVILANHGMVGVGETIRQALDACEMVEKAAHVYFLALTTGRVNPLSAEATQALKTAFTRIRKTR
jgi:L-fuculose-phosphate aldolase